jgi:hypothetical protein
LLGLCIKVLLISRNTIGKLNAITLKEFKQNLLVHSLVRVGGTKGNLVLRTRTHIGLD